MQLIGIFAALIGVSIATHPNTPTDASVGILIILIGVALVVIPAIKKP